MAGIEFVVARIFELARPGIERVGRGLGSLAVEASGVEAGRADERIALGAAIDGGELLSRSLQRPVRLDLVGIRRELVSDRRRHSAPGRSAAARRPHPPRGAGVRRGSPGQVPPEAPIIWLRSKALVNSSGSCSASAVIETSTTRATHQGAATERAHPIRERPIPEASARALVSRPRAAALRKSAQCEPFRLSALNLAGPLPRVRAGRPGLGQEALSASSIRSGA